MPFARRSVSCYPGSTWLTGAAGNALGGRFESGFAGCQRGEDGKATAHINERFEGRLRRVVSLPDDIEPAGVNARYRDGVLHVSVQRRESAQPRRIEVQ